jgi:formate dehydrogenase subunit beta
MSEYYLIEYNDFKQILKTLLKEKIVNKIVSGVMKKSRFAVDPEIITDPNQLDNFPLSQLLVYNYNRIGTASKFLHKQGGALKEKIAIVGHPCDGRALVELEKRVQVKLDNIFLIIMEDYGTILVKDIQELLKKENKDPESIFSDYLTADKLILKTKNSEKIEFKLGEKISINGNCSRCDIKKLDKNFDLAITTISLDPESNKLIIRIGSQKGRDALEKSKIKKTELDSDKIITLNECQTKIMDAARVKKEKELKDYLANPDRIKEIAKCTACGICIMACPVCFCASCVLQAQKKEKTIDILTYQLTRVAHVGDSCVNCGKCDQNCPQGLPLTFYFQSMNESVRKDFNYVSGCNLEQDMPRSQKAVRKIQ